MKAKLIGEKSAGMTAVEIYDNNDDLIWSHRWFDNGCTNDGYIAGLIDAVDCMLGCAAVSSFDGGEIDSDGDPIPIDTHPTTGVMLVYDTETGWALGDDARRMGQSSEIIDALMLAGMLDKDDEHADDAIVAAIANHLQAVAA